MNYRIQSLWSLTSDQGTTQAGRRPAIPAAWGFFISDQCYPAPIHGMSQTWRILLTVTVTPLCLVTSWCPCDGQLLPHHLSSTRPLHPVLDELAEHLKALGDAAVTKPCTAPTFRWCRCRGGGQENLAGTAANTLSRQAFRVPSRQYKSYLQDPESLNPTRRT